MLNAVMSPVADGIRQSRTSAVTVPGIIGNRYPIQSHIPNPTFVPRTRSGSDRHGRFRAGVNVSAINPGTDPSATAHMMTTAISDP
jgi:hypothetical protein